MRTPTKREFLRVLEVEGWTDKGAVAGRKTGNHLRFVFTTPRGERLYTMVPHGTKPVENANHFQYVLREQLQISADEFWLAVDKGIAPTRPAPNPVQEERRGSIDIKLSANLIRKVGLTPRELARMTPAEAVATWNDWLAKHPGG